MKFKKSLLRQMVREELTSHLGGLLGEGPKPDVEDAQGDNKKKEKGSESPSPEPDSKEPEPKAKPAKELPVEDPDDEDPKSDDAEDASQVTGGQISKQLQGKSIQSITMEPKSKIMPGAQEIVLQFSEIPDPLRILIGKTGIIKFYFKGIHNKI